MLRQNPAYRPGFSRFIWLGAGTLLSACRAGVPRQPVLPPAASRPAPAVAQPPAFWRVSSDALTRTYQVAQDAIITTTTDSTSATDSLALRVTASVRRTADGGAAGLILSATLQNAATGEPAVLPGLTVPFAFGARPYSEKSAARPFPLPEGEDACATPAATALLPLQDLLIAVPDSLYAGMAWSDSSTTPVCRGGVRLAFTVARQFRFRGTGMSDSLPVLYVDRTSRAIVAGTALRGTDTTHITGTGTGALSFVLEAATGTLRNATGWTSLDLVIQSSTQRERSHQSTSVRIRRNER